MENKDVRILVVDDEPTMSDSLKQNLAEEGYATDTAATGAEAIELFDQGGHHVAICDLQLPDMDGLEVVRHIKDAKPLTEPTERSISPTIRTQTIPSEITPTVEQSNSMLTRLLLDRKIGLSAWNIVQMITSPTMTGSEPRSPERTRSINARTAPPRLSS